jgi:antitoxin (DNA-binding transcriptional repressor) of toxin-antitoxin stability system
MTVAVEATETDLPTLLEQIEHGDEVQLMKNGQTVARIVPHSDTPD